ncbi:MAG: ChuX/HutX family heme-like substrate-binding protein [Gemmatimonadota bacterium]
MPDVDPLPAAPDPEALTSSWAWLTEREPHLRIRDAAARLGVAESQLLATRCGDGVERIRLEPARILPRLRALGRLLALTRNEAFVHERSGVYEECRTEGPVLSVTGPEVDLRIFPAAWDHAYAQTDVGAHGARLSLHFFDAHGEAVHKIHSTSETDQPSFQALVAELRAPRQDRVQPVRPPSPVHRDRPDSEVDPDALEAGWRALTDTHAFHGLLRRLRVGRTQALRMVPDELARPTPVLSLRTVLETAAAEGLPMVLFVRSPGTLQIHHGTVHDVQEAQGWFNVLDRDFNLHVLESAIGGAWVVRKPVEPAAGWVTSLEFYDPRGSLQALFFGQRPRGAPEDPRWTGLLTDLPGAPVPHPG